MDDLGDNGSDGEAQPGGVVAQLESDIAAVASALETIDRIVAEDGASPRAADEIEAVVSEERFSAGDSPQPAP